MATKNQKKRAVKKVAKQAKKNPKIFIILFLLLLAIGGVVLVLYFTGTLDNIINKINGAKDAESTQTTPQSTAQPTSSQSSPAQSTGTGAHSHEDEDGIVENIIYDNFQIHFLELGNDRAGDSVYIKAGDKDILIDAGSLGSSSTTIINYVNNYCTDGKLEYVIATHAHKDHIAGFAGTVNNKAKNYKGETVGRTGVLYYYDVENLIDFAYTEKTGVDNKTAVSGDYSSGTEYGKYLSAREFAIGNNTVHTTAKELWDSNNTTITLAEGLTMDILYNYYYFNSSSDENNYSVCTMFNYNNHHFVLTGDLEKEGEEKLAEYYDGTTPEKTLPHCDLFKGGHHGSPTSSNECLLEKLTPSMCCVCCCAGTSEYTPCLERQFPSQAFINRIAQYTSRVYVTSMIEYIDNEWKFTSMNGNIIVSFNGTKVGLNASNNLIRLKDTEWFNEKIYAVKTSEKDTWNRAGDKIDIYKNCDRKDTTNFYTSETAGAVLVSRRVWPQNGVQ